jgi:hypothetical protein
MSDAATPEFYRRPSKERLAQGDIGFAEIVQVRSASGSERAGPGPEEVADGDLPFLGPYTDHELPVAKVGGGEERRILRVWTTLGLVVSQNCELEWANPSDSRVSVAPIVTRDQWPEGPWELFRSTPPPGYFYLPPLDAAAASELGMADPWPEAIGCLASASVTTSRIVKPRRLLSTSVAALPRLQDALARLYSTRGFADLAALSATVGKPIRAVVETGQTVSGPSQLIKVFFGEAEGDSNADDEVSVSYWGVRASRARETSGSPKPGTAPKG